MSDISSTSSEIHDTSIEAFEEYFGTDVDLEDLAEMSAEERQAWFEQLYAQNPDVDADAFEEALKEDLEEFYTTLYTYYKDLDDLLDSGELSNSEEVNVEMLMEDLKEWMELCDEDINSAWGDALGEYNEKNVEVDAGDTYTVTPDDPQNGDEYVITFSEEESSDSGSVFNSDENADWIDTDGDGYREKNPDEDSDGIADEDFDGDGAITEADMTYGQNTSDSVAVLDLEESDTLYCVSYDEDTNTAKFRVTQEDGTIYYITITGADKIVTGSNVPTNYENLPTTLLGMMYENETSANSYHYHVYGSEPDNGTGDYYSIYDMSEKYDETTGTNSLEIAPTDEDFENGREYTIECESEQADAITIDLEQYGEDAKISFSTDADGNVVMTVTTDKGTITITFAGLECSIFASMNDTINIIGGEIDWNASDLDDLNIPFLYYDEDDPAVGGIPALWGIVTHDGKTLTEEGEEEGHTTGVSGLEGWLELLGSS